MSENKFDIVIVGAGLVGGAFALMLAKHKLKVAVIEVKSNTVKEGLGKAIALSDSSKQIFSSLRLWEKLSAQATAIKQVHVSEKNHFGVVKLKASDANLDALGYLINEPDLSKAISASLADKALTWFRPATVVALSEKGKDQQLTLTLNGKQKKILAKLVVAADGQNSSLRDLLGIKIEQKDYNESALVCRVKISGNHENTAYERFTKSGTIALMPQPKQTVALIISANNDEAKKWQALDDEAFILRLQEMVGYRLGRLRSKDKLLCFPLRQKIAKQQTKDGVILLGASAHSFHPIAAQGLNLCLREAQMLSELISNAENNSDYFSGVINEYQQRALSIQKPVMRMTEMVAKHAGKQTLSARVMRQFGLLAFEYSDTLKKHMIETGIGKKE